MRWQAGLNPFLRHPAVSLSLLLLLCLPLFLRVARLEIRPDARILLEGDQRSLAAFEKVDEILHRETVVVISMEGDGLFSQRGFDDLRALSDRLCTVPGLIDVKSLTHSVKPVRKGFSFEMVKFVPEGELPADEIERIRRFCLTHPLVRNVMVAADARHLLVTATFNRPLRTPAQRHALREEVDAALAAFQAKGYRFHTIAMPFAEDEIYTTLRSDAVRVGSVAALGALAVLWLAFRSPRIVALVVVNLAVALAGAAGLVQWMGVALTIYTVMLLPLLGGVHLTLMAHQFIAYQHALRAGQPHDGAMAAMVRRVLKPSAFAVLTTGIGLGSLAVCDVAEVRRFGIAGAAGAGWVFLWAFGPGLALAQLALRPPANRTAEAAVPRASERWTAIWPRWCAAVVGRRSLIFSAGVGASALAVAGAFSVRTDIRVVEFLDRSSPIRQSLEEMNRVYGGFNVVQIEIDTGRTNGVNDLAFLRYLEGVAGFAGKQPGVSGVYSYPQLLAMMNQIWEQETPGSLRLPDTPLLVNLFATALKARNYPFLTALVNDSMSRAFLVVRSQDMPSGRYLATVRNIVGHARAHRPEGVEVSAAAGIHSILEADRRILRAQTGTALLTLGAVWLALALLWRSLWLPALALLANVIPVGLVLGVAGLADIPLNSVTVMIAAIVLSIAVDDSVHLLTWWREERRNGLSPLAALEATLREKGAPIVCTSVVLVAVFGAFLLFSFPPVRHFGVLSALAFAAALVSVLTFLPAALAGRRHS